MPSQRITPDQLAKMPGLPEVDYVLDRPPYTRYYWDGGKMVELGGAVSGAGNALKKRIVSDLGGWRIQATPQSNGTTQTSGTDRARFVTFSDCVDLEFLYVNGYLDPTGQINPNSNILQIRASLDQAPQCLPVPFKSSTGTVITGGSNAAVAIPDQGILMSEPMPVPVVAGVAQYVRTYKVVTAGQKWPYVCKVPSGSTTTDQVNGSTEKTGIDTTSVYAAAMAGPSGSSVNVFCPTAVIGVMNPAVPVVMVSGDSIADGASATTGYLQKAFTDATGWGIHTDAVAGCVIVNLNKYDIVIGILAKYVDVVAFHMGTNDLANASITTLAGYQTELKKVLMKLGGCKNVWPATILPRTSSTDTFATVANQTPFAAESLRISINNWLRASAVSWAYAQGLPLTGIIDNCVGYERNSDGSLMSLSVGQQSAGTGGRHPATGAVNGYTSDGIHPNDTAVAVLKTLVPVAAIRTACGF